MKSSFFSSFSHNGRVSVLCGRKEGRNQRKQLSFFPSVVKKSRLLCYDIIQTLPFLSFLSQFGQKHQKGPSQNPSFDGSRSTNCPSPDFIEGGGGGKDEEDAILFFLSFFSVVFFSSLAGVNQSHLSTGRPGDEEGRGLSPSPGKGAPFSGSVSGDITVGHSLHGVRSKHACK